MNSRSEGENSGASRGLLTPIETLKGQRLEKAREELQGARGALETLKQAPGQNAAAIVRMDAIIEKLFKEIHDLENELNPQKLSELQRKRRKNAEAAGRCRAKQKTRTEHWANYAMEMAKLLSQNGIEVPTPPDDIKREVGWMCLFPQSSQGKTTSTGTRVSDSVNGTSSESRGFSASALVCTGILGHAQQPTLDSRAIKTEGPMEDFIIIPSDRLHTEGTKSIQRVQLDTDDEEVTCEQRAAEHGETR